MRPAAVLLLAFTTGTIAILLVEENAARHLVDSSLGSILGGAETRIPEERPADEMISVVDTLELSASANPSNTLEKRRGGGGGGRGGGGGGGRVGGGKSSSGGSSGAGGSRSIAGGRTTTGSGTPKSQGGYYGGGGAVPFTSGGHSASGILPVVLSVSLASTIFTGTWMYGSLYAYHFTHDVNYRNTTSNGNETLPVLCLCQQYSVCGCDENHNQTYIDALVANATNATGGAVERTKIAVVNGTRTLLINGTLDNGTTADGGTEVVSEAAGQRLGLVLIAFAIALSIFFA